MLLTLYVKGFHDEIIILAETGQAKIEDKETLVFLINLWLNKADPQPHRALELASLAHKRLEHKAGHESLVKETFGHLVTHIADKGHVCQILNSLASVTGPTLAAVEQALAAVADRKYLIVFLIFVSRLAEANAEYANYKIKIKGSDDLLELLLAGRNNAMPAVFKFRDAQADLARLHFVERSTIN